MYFLTVCHCVCLSQACSSTSAYPFLQEERLKRNICREQTAMSGYFLLHADKMIQTYPSPHSHFDFFSCWMYRKHFSAQVANKSSLDTYAHGWIFRDGKNKHPEQFHSKRSISAGVSEVQGWTTQCEFCWKEVASVHCGSWEVCFILSELTTLEFQHLKELEAKTSYQIMSSPCTVCALQHRLHKILLQVFPQNLDRGLTSRTQKELKNYHPGFGVSEQKPQCLPAQTLAKQCYLQHRLWFQEASVGLSENLGCRGTPATPTTEGTDLQQD